jgi:hypothetical protein
MTELKALTGNDLTKGEKVAVANPDNPNTYFVGVVTGITKQITVETNEFEFFHS